MFTFFERGLLCVAGVFVSCVVKIKFFIRNFLRNNIYYCYSGRE